MRTSFVAVLRTRGQALAKAGMGQSSTPADKIQMLNFGTRKA